MIDSKRINEWMEATTDAVVSEFKANGEVEPRAIFFNDNDNVPTIGVMPLTPFMVNEEGKDLVAKVIRGMCKSHNTVALAFITEAWALELSMDGKSKEDIEGDYENGNLPRPSQSPNRIEILHITYETKVHSHSETYKIIRDGGDVRLGEPQIMNGEDGLGRFSNLIEKP